MNYKICTKCGGEFPATTEFFYKYKKSKFGLRAECKICNNKCSQKYYKNNRERLTATMKKYCRNNKEKIAINKAEYQEINKEKIAVVSKRYYENNKERFIARQAEWQKNNKEKHNTYNAKYRKNNPDKIAAHDAKWKKANPEKVAVHNAKRRAEKLNQTPCLTQDEKHQIELIYKKSQELGSGWQVDHIRPLSKGGLHHPDNLQIVLKGYNLQKNDKIDFRLPTIEELYIV